MIMKTDFARTDRQAWVRELMTREKALAALIRKTRNRPILPAERYRAALKTTTKAA